MRLLIVESPTKGFTLKRFLGPNYKVLSSYGHIRDLPEDEFGVDVENDFKPKYIIIPRARKTVQFLKKEAEKADLIILSCDPDREGEAIAWHLVQALCLNEIKNEKLKTELPSMEAKVKKRTSSSSPIKNYQRIVFHEITKQAIEEALKNPRDIDLDLVDAQQARRILDRLVGYKLSPFLWKKVARGLSAGRVQSVAVRLVVEREREIQNFVPQEYWTIVAHLKKLVETGSLPTEFEAILVKKDGEVIPKLGIKTKREADEIVKDLEGAEYKVVNIEKKELKRNPLPPFTTSTLQQEAWQRFRFPAKFTMQIAQQLYEKGFITYHRTDSLNLSDLSLFAAKKFIVKNYGEKYWAGFLRKYKTKTKGAQEAHEAIRPTYPDRIPEKLKLGEEDKSSSSSFAAARIYDVIWRRFIACQMSQAVFDTTTVDIQVKNYTFRANGQILKFDGFLKVYPMKFAGLRPSHASAKASAYEETELPPLKISEILELIKLIPSQHFTQPHPRYSEATLIKALEENGIGRPSTYAPILSNIQEKNYIEKDENKRFRPTEIGTVVNDILVKHFPEIVDVKFTAEMETELDEIAQGEKKWVKVCKEFYEPFEKNLKNKYEEVSKKEFTEKPTEKKCPKCGSQLLIRLGKYGEFYACSKFPKCKHTESLEKNTLGIKCPKCAQGDVILKRTKKRKIFYGCINWPKCDFASWDKPTGEFCPKCNSFLIETSRGQIKCSDKNCLSRSSSKTMVRDDYKVEKEGKI